MKTTSKILCLILALMLMIPMIASCTKPQEQKQEEEPATGPSDEVYTMTGLDEKKYDNEKFVIGYSYGGGSYISQWIPKPINPKTEDLKSDNVAEASYKRDVRFEKLTGARISYEGYATNPNTWEGAYS